jgi:hypothetical protein
MPSPGSSGKGKRLVIGNGADPEPAAATEQKPAACTWSLALPAGLAMLAFAIGFAAERDDGPH